MSKILNYLVNHQNNMVKTLEQWVNQDSSTYNKQDVDKMGLIIAQAFQDSGASKVTHPQPKLGDHYTLSWQYPQATGQILLIGHFDTVWPDNEAIRRPFTIQNGKATGPGVSDMKAGLLIACFAMQAIKALNLKPNKNVVFLLNSDEEIGSPTSRSLIETEGAKSDFCLVFEPARHGCLTTWRKGIGNFELTVTGLASHAGVDHEKGVSAIEELAHQILTLQAMTDYKQGITVNIGTISGGTRYNVIPAQAKAQIDLRITTKAQGETMTNAIKALQPKLSGTTLSITGGINRPPFEETPAGLALFQKAQTIATQLGFEVGKKGSGGGSDANFVSALGVPTLDALGGVGGGSHALSEHTFIEHLPKRAALAAELIMAL